MFALRGEQWRDVTVPLMPGIFVGTAPLVVGHRSTLSSQGMLKNLGPAVKEGCVTISNPSTCFPPLSHQWSLTPPSSLSFLGDNQHQVHSKLDAANTFRVLPVTCGRGCYGSHLPALCFPVGSGDRATPPLIQISGCQALSRFKIGHQQHPPFHQIRLIWSINRSRRDGSRSNSSRSRVSLSNKAWPISSQINTNGFTTCFRRTSL